MTSEQPGQPRQYRDMRRQGADDVPEGAHPTTDQPVHGERRPVAAPFAITVGLIVIILVVMLVMFLL
jgi:hypothetical protein